jgi:hypothetical protein
MRKIIDYHLLDGLALEHYNRINPKLSTPKTERDYPKKSVQYKLKLFSGTQPLLHKPFYQFVENNLEKIITSPPHQLLDINKEIKKKWLSVDPCLKNLEANFKDLLEKVFDYEGFRNGNLLGSRNTLWFNSLNLKTCPYCNRNWISHVTNENGIVKHYFDIDHYFPKYEYPWFALSFYNLIPSCTICNQRIKGKKKLNLLDHLHPYLDDFDELVKFNVPTNSLDVFFDKNVKIELDIIPRPPLINEDENFKRAKNHYEFFNLKNLYEIHLDYVRELLQKRIIYSKSYVELLKKDYEEIFSSPDEIPRMLFGNYVLPDQIHERPLAKLTKDLIEDFL